ncbi:MAG TPA: hypothetical protein VMV41_03390 [Cellulomonadaceae bacterium]|nr:hypothetical protein [Cellulomonadaceae bacterium]
MGRQHVYPDAPHDRSQIVCDRIIERIADLTEPVTTRETQWVPSALATRLEQKITTTEHPPLIVQLDQVIGGSTAGSSSSGHDSKPPGSLDAIDCLRTIRKQSRWWLKTLTAISTSDLGADLVTIGSRAHELDATDLRYLDADVLRWWARARIVTTWDLAPIKTNVPCMVCSRRGGLQIRLDPLAAVCRHCGSAWDSSTIGILGEHVRLAMSDPAPELETTR